MGEPKRIGIVGLGVISQAYLSTLSTMAGVRVSAVADLDHDRARAVAAGIPGAEAVSTAELVARPDVDVVLNLTIPAAHAEVARSAIDHGKHVYNEKPLTSDAASAAALVAAAEQAGVWLGCAPDTVLGTGIQTARRAIDDGLIGSPTAATAVMVTAGHERWHARPDFYYQPGGGPLLDMGPYYVTSLVHLLGPIRSVIGAASTPRSTRTIGTGPRAGQVIPVEVETHVSGILEHESGVLSTLTTSFEGTRTTAAPIEVHGERGSLAVPDPNTFGGDVRSILTGDDEWSPVAVSAGYAESARGIGLLDFAFADAARPPRADGALALHVLEAMESLLVSARSGERVTLRTTAARPSPVALTPAAEWSAWV